MRRVSCVVPSLTRQSYNDFSISHTTVCLRSLVYPRAALQTPNLSPIVAKTPCNINQLTTHADRLLQFRPHNPDTPVSQALSQLIKGGRIAMHSVVLLADENPQLRSENQYQKKKKITQREFINDDGTLSVAEGQAKIQQRKEEKEAAAMRRRERKDALAKRQSHTVRRQQEKEEAMVKRQRDADDQQVKNNK